MPQLIVIICTHNPRPAYIAETLAALRAQTLPVQHWDLLIVDNASKERLEGKLDLSWHPKARIVRETKLGTAQARMRGLKEAEASGADLLLFVDDDNILRPDYLSQGLMIEEVWPQLGAWGGQLLARYEAEPPPWLENYKKFLAIFPLKKALWANQVYSYDVLPPTAGCFLRRAVWVRYLELIVEEPRHLDLGPKGDDPTRGEDTDLILTAIDVGLGVGRFPELTLDHIMPSSRFAIPTMENLITGVYAGTALLEFIRFNRRPENPARSWWQKQIIARRARRLPDPIGKFYLAEIKGRTKALETIERWSKNPAKPSH